MTDDVQNTDGDVDVDSLIGKADTGDGIADVDAILEGVGEDAEPDQPGQTLVPAAEGEDVDLTFDGMSETDPEIAAALQGEWGSGAQFHDNMRFAQTALQEFATPELYAAFEESGLGDDPGLIKVLAKIGRQLTSTPGDPSTVRHQPQTQQRTNTMADTKEQLQTKIDRLHALQHSPDIREQQQYKTGRVQDALRKMYVQLDGNQPIVGEGGRIL